MTWLEAFEDASLHSVPEALLRRPSHERVPTTAAELGLPAQMDGDGPLVSVVIPTYGDDHFLPEALQSVGSQTHSNLELWIVDSSQVGWLESLAADREWIQYLPQEPLGLPRARNDAIERANGEFVALLDADDYWHPEKIERQLTALGETAVLCYTAVYRVCFDSDPPTVTCRDLRGPDPDRAVRDQIEGRITVTPSSVVFRRDPIPDRPFEESLDAWEDGFFYIETFKSYPPVAVTEPLVVYRDHNQSITADQQRMSRNVLEGASILMATYPDLREPLEQLRIRHERALARYHLERNEKREARRYLFQIVRRANFGYKTIAFCGAAWFPGNSSRSVKLLQRLHDILLR